MKHSCIITTSMFPMTGAAIVPSTRNVHDTMRLYTLMRALRLLSSTIRYADKANTASSAYILPCRAHAVSHTASA